MDIQGKIIKAMLITTIGCLGIYSVLHFALNGFTVESVLMWCSQVAISVCTSALVTYMVARASYKQMKKNYYHSLGKEFRRLYNCVDDYLCILELNDLYFEEYYSFRNEFLGCVLIPERESISLKEKDRKVFEEAVTELYLRPSNYLYYSYIRVKKLEKEFLQEKSNQSYKTRMQYKRRLDLELAEMNEYFIALKKENKYNVTAELFYKKAGMDKAIQLTMDNCESTYKTKFYQEAACTIAPENETEIFLRVTKSNKYNE